MRSNNPTKESRIFYVNELWGLGFTADEIAKIFDWSVSTVSKDILYIGGLKEFPNRPLKRDVYSTVISRYAQIMISQQDDDDNISEETKILLEILEKYFGKNEIIAMLKGLDIAIGYLQTPAFYDKYNGYASLLAQLFEININGGPSFNFRFPLLYVTWFNEMLFDIHSGNEIVPSSQHHFYNILVRRILNKHRADIMPIWDESVFIVVDEMMRIILLEREYQVICKRCGIPDNKKLSLQEVGSELNVSHERVRQVESRAMRKLKKQMQIRNLEILVMPVGNALQVELQRRKTFEISEQLINQVNIDIKILLESVDTLELSVRSSNILCKHDIALIGELVQFTENDLLNQKGCGRKSLQEIIYVLNRINLNLGMEIREDIKVIINQRKLEFKKL